MEQDVLHAVVGNDETVTAPRVEPFDESIDLDDPDIRLQFLFVNWCRFTLEGATGHHDLYPTCSWAAPRLHFPRYPRLKMITSRGFVQR